MLPVLGGISGSIKTTLKGGFIIINAVKVEAVGGSRGRSAASFAGGEDLTEFFQSKSTMADFNGGSDEVPDHAKEKAVPGDSDSDERT
jgi:hypothetical protein